MHERFEGFACAGNQILFDRVLALLTYLINLRDTLVIASGRITWGLPVPFEKKRGGVCRRTTVILFSQIVCSKYSARGGAVSFTRLKMSYVV
jgi:hypothetical protein